MLIERKAADILKRYAQSYPVVTITGPRQSGKTTLVKMVFPQKEYFNLENPEVRAFARENPGGFLSRLSDGAIIDEIQRVPDLLSYIMTIVDERGQNGLFILTGSAQLDLLDSISQSLAGRTALLRLLPFDLREAYGKGGADAVMLDEILYRGFYPGIFNRNLNPSEALSFYVETYLQRDVRSILNVKDLDAFERFLQVCAGRTGQLVNHASIANDLGLSHNTVKNWLSVLKASYIITFLRPLHSNINKRVTKSPKLYFLDVGLAAFLLGIDHVNELRSHPLRGALFETLVVSECLKHRFNTGKRNNIYFFRDKTGNEVDIILKHGNHMQAIEVKSSETFHSDFTRGLHFFQRLFPGEVKDRGVVYGGSLNQDRGDIEVVGFRDMAKIFATNG
jgi:predicted AAA+ superfamily ATPase